MGEVAVRQPLPALFLGGTDEYAVTYRDWDGMHMYGPFLSDAVAQAWGDDAFGRGNFAVCPIERPWTVSPEHRKS